MRQDLYYASCGIGRIHYCKWVPEGQPKAVLQIIHGIAEHVMRYSDFAEFLNQNGILVVAEDHMGHGQSVGNQGIQGYFHGGWFAAVEDSYHLMQRTREEYPEIPYILFGHSMGSFMTRTILEKYPDSGIDGAIICGTGWQPYMLLNSAKLVTKRFCQSIGEQTPSKKLQEILFGGFNHKVEHQRTEFDWLSRDDRIVDEYIRDPQCGFVVTAGLFRDLLAGMSYVQDKNNLKFMRKDLPVLFIAGGDDPVGAYGKGVQKSAEAFRTCGMQHVGVKLYPLCRHEILNEINREEIYDDVLEWIRSVING